MVFLQTQGGAAEQFSTIEKVRYWLQRKWPVTDIARDTALKKVEGAMECMGSVEDARKAFVIAAISAGFIPSAGDHHRGILSH